MDISVIIVNYNTGKHLRTCLDSLFKYISNIDYEVIVVDNNSHDRDIEKISLEYPRARFIFREVNDGFGAGCNFGSKYAIGKYILFVNPDIIFFDNVNYELFKIIESSPHIAVLSPMYLEDNGSFKYIFRHSPGYIWTISETFGNYILESIPGFRNKKETLIKEPFEVDWVMGSFMFIRSETFRAIDGFDETMFLYYEDIDLQKRIKALGYKIFYFPKYTIKHFERSSVRTYQGENLYYFHMARSNLIYMYKHFNFFKRNILRFLNISGLIGRIIILPFRKTFVMKRKQKYFQYMRTLKQYFSGKQKIFNNIRLEIKDDTNSMKQITHNDSFWN